MASEWIKVRTNLRVHPKVSQMVEVLSRDHEFLTWMLGSAIADQVTAKSSSTGANATELALQEPLRALPNSVTQLPSVVTLKFFELTTRIVIAGLVDVWASANSDIKEDDCIDAVNGVSVDYWAGIPGFYRAMLAVGWVEKTEKGLRFPNFHEFNTPTKERPGKKTNAQKQKEYRERKKAEELLLAQEAQRSALTGSTQQTGCALPSVVTNVVTCYPDKIRLEENIEIQIQGGEEASKLEEAKDSSEPVVKESLIAPKRPRKPKPSPADFPDIEPINDWAVCFKQRQTPDQSKAASLVPLTLQTQCGRFLYLTPELYASVEREFACCDIVGEVKSMQAGLEAQPIEKRKTANGIKMFIRNWLGKAKKTDPAPSRAYKQY